MRRALLWLPLCSLIVIAGAGVQAAPRQEQPPGKGRLRLVLSSGMVSWIDPATMEAAVRPILAMIAAPYPGLTYSVRSDLRGREVTRVLAAGEANAALISTEEYLQIAGVKVIVVVRSATASGSTFHLKLAVSSTSGITGVRGLAGKRVSLCVNEPIQRVYLETLLARAKVDRSSVAARDKQDVKSPVLDVLLHEATACVVSSEVLAAMAELNPQLHTRLKVIAESEALATPPLVARADTERAVLAAIQKVSLTLHTTERGRQMLRLFRTPRLILARDSDYDSYRQLLAEHRRHYRGED